MISYIKGKSIITLFLNHELTDIYNLFGTYELTFCSHTEGWLLPDLYNQEVALIEPSRRLLRRSEYTI